VIEPAHPRPLRVTLALVETLAVGLPEIERCTRDRLVIEAAHREKQTDRSEKILQ
jgi:hypothetical protein